MVYSTLRKYRKHNTLVHQLCQCVGRGCVPFQKAGVESTYFAQAQRVENVGLFAWRNYDSFYSIVSADSGRRDHGRVGDRLCWWFHLAGRVGLAVVDCVSVLVD